MIDIVITHYKEPVEVGMPLLRMIGLQRGIDMGDVRVKVVNDGGERLPEDALAGLGYPVEQIDILHKGISAARNAGIDNASNPWIMFCDFDDCFANLYALRDIMTVLPANGYDMLWSKLLVEDFCDGSELLYITPEPQRFVFTHAKVYRVDFLRDHGIRFDESLSFQEDSLFNATIIARTSHKRIGEIKTQAPMYVWIRRNGSVTQSGRQDEAIFGQFVRNIKTTEENRQHREHEAYCGMVTRTVWDTYYMIRSSRASPQTKRRILDLFIPWISERMAEYGNVDSDTLKQIRKISRMELMEQPVPDSPGSVNKWLEMTIGGAANA